MIKFTNKAVNQLNKFMEDEARPGVRVMVKPGGCAGFAYGLELDNPEEDDHVLEQDGIEIYIDPFSMQYLQGTTVDWIDDMMYSGFSFDNPNAVGGCGCGTSFEV